MGCGTTNTKEEEINNTLYPIINKIQLLIDENPLYEQDYDDLLKIIKKHENKNLLEIYSFISKEFDFDKIITEILKDVLTFSEKKLKYLFPKNEVNKNILSILYFFCANSKNTSTKEEKQKYLKHLLKTALLKKQNKKYYSWKLSNIIVNIIQFSLFCFVYLFGSRAILIQINDFPIEGLELIYIEKRSFRGIKPEDFGNYVTQLINSLSYGKEDHHKFMVNILLSNVFQPISDVIIKNPNLEIVDIENDKINKIIDNLSRVLDANGIYNHLFYLRLHEIVL